MSKRYKNSDFEEAIKGSGGIMSAVAKRVGCDWQTAQRFIKNSDKLAKMFEAEREIVLDMAESTLFNSIKAGDTSDAKWLLSRLGKERGYAERKELTGADGEAIELTMKQLRELPDDDLLRIIEG